MIYLFPGLGASEKLFRAYDFAPYRAKVIPFLVPEKNESLVHYCHRMADAIHPSEENIYIGVSFGGIIAQEIARFLTAKKIIIISSIKSSSEMPGYFSIARLIPLHRMLPPALIKKLGVTASEIIARKSESEKQLFRELVRDADHRVIKWGVHQVLHWHQNISPPDIVHIHGDRDLIFPISRIKADHVIRGGKHFMIMREVKEIQALLMQLLNEEPAAVK